MNAETGSKSASNRWSATLALLMLCSLLCLGGVLFSPVIIAQGGTRTVPVRLQSNLRADYSADEFALAIPGAGIDLIGSAIQDQISVTDAPLRLSTLISDLQTAVPTVTPQYNQPAVEATPTRIFVPTRRGPATATSAPEHPTDEPREPTSTLAPTASPTPLPTRTRVPPTDLPPTQVPPTAVPPTQPPPTAVPPTREPYPPPPPPATEVPPPQPTNPPPQPTDPPPQPTDPPPYP